MNSARLFLAIYDGIGGAMLADFQTRALGLKFSKNKHGCASATWSVACSLYEGFRLQGTLQGKHAEISASGHPVWNGRVEDVSLTETGVDITALGYQVALKDSNIIQMWSTTHASDWEVVYSSILAAHQPDKYRLTNQNGIVISLQRGDTYANNSSPGGMMYRIPSGSSRNITTLTFDYKVTLPTNVYLVFEAYDSSWSLLNQTGIIAGNGATQTGSSSPSFTACAAIVLYVINLSGASYTATGETGTQYAQVTNLRVKSTSSASLYASEIATSIAAYVSSINPSQLLSSSTLIQSPGLDLRDEVYEDATPSDILDYLAALGDTSAPPRVWEWGVTIDQALYFRPRGSGRTWTIDAGTLDLQQSMDGLRNAAYATYQDASGRTLRTATTTDPISIKRFGITRTIGIGTQTTVSAQATTHRDAALADGANPRPRSGFDGIRWIFDTVGMPSYPWLANPGDVVSVRNLNPTSSADIDRVRTFVLSEMEFDADSGLATLTPEDPTPSLDVITARYSANMGFVSTPAFVTNRDPRQPQNARTYLGRR